MFFGLHHGRTASATATTTGLPWQAGQAANSSSTEADALGLPHGDWIIPYPGPAERSFLPASQWQLRLEGGVVQPVTLSYGQLLSLPQAHQLRRIGSREGWLYKAEWEGCLLRYVLQQVQLQPNMRYVTQTNAQGEQCSLPLEALLKQDAMLVLRVGRQPLSPWHGGPVRLLLFEQYWEWGLGQLTTLRFTATAEQPPEGPEQGRIQPGKYYLMDAKTFKVVDRAGEVRQL